MPAAPVVLAAPVSKPPAEATATTGPVPICKRAAAAKPTRTISAATRDEKSNCKPTAAATTIPAKHAKNAAPITGASSRRSWKLTQIASPSRRAIWSSEVNTCATPDQKLPMLWSAVCAPAGSGARTAPTPKVSALRPRLSLDITINEVASRRGDQDPANPDGPEPARPADTESDDNAQRVKQPGRDNKTDTEGQGVRGVRELHAMGMPVRQCENTDDRGRNPKRQPLRQGHHCAENGYRQRDQELGGGQGNPDDPEDRAGGHHQRKGHRKEPDRRCSEFGAPDPDTHHREKVIGACERVQQAGTKTATHPLDRMRERGRGGEQ